jgi:hypothetical protein
MNGYAVALFFHLLCLMIACVAASLTMYAALRLRSVESASEAMQWGRLIRRVTPAFPLVTAGLLGTGAIMTQERWSWSTPWIVAGLIGLGVIVLLGPVIDGGRSRLLQRELEASGMSSRARRLLRDPMAWSSKTMTFGVVMAVVFIMATKPTAAVAASALALGLVAGAVAAVPLWRPRAASGELEAAAASP